MKSWEFGFRVWGYSLDRSRSSYESGLFEPFFQWRDEIEA